MARTRLTARRSTGGKSCCRRAQPPIRWGRWRYTDWLSRDEMGSVWRKTTGLKTRESVRHTMQLRPRQRLHPKRPDRLTVLPTELLFQILEPLVPQDRVYHFEAIAADSGEMAYSVHSIAEHNGVGRDPISHEHRYHSMKPSAVTPYALTCQRFKSIVYSLTYGRNQFAVEIGRSRLDQRRGIAVARDVRPMPYIWNKLVPVHPDTLNSPLTATTIRYITRLFVCIGVRPEGEVSVLRRTLMDFASCFDDINDDSTKDRDIAVAVASHDVNHSQGSVFEIVTKRSPGWRLQFADTARCTARGLIGVRQCLSDDVAALQWIQNSRDVGTDSSHL